MTSDAEKLRKDTEDILERERNYKEALRLALDWQGGRKNHKVTLPTRMGSSKSYLASASLGWIAANVYLARDLPMFRKRIGDNAAAVDVATANRLWKGFPDFSRQLPMTRYLATREHRKFPPLLVVAFQDWVCEPGHDNWGPDGRALTGSLHVERLDTRSFVVDLEVTRTSYFAFDGQHRLMAIKGLKELLDNGRLGAKSTEGTAIPGTDVTKDELEGCCEKEGLDPNRLLKSMDEDMGVEIVPAVQDRETFEEAARRLRVLFFDVNERGGHPEKAC